MGFYRDFQNEIKIFFVVVVLLVLAGWFGALSSLSFSRVVEQPQPAVQTEKVQESGVQVAEDQKEIPEIQQELPVYMAENLGISFEYPEDWFVYDEAAWLQDNTIRPCETEATIENTVIVSSKNLGRCVGVQEFHSWPGDMLVSFSETEWEDFPFILAGENPGLAEVDGVPVAAYLFSESSSVNRKQAVRLYGNTAGRGYIIEFTQRDLQGNYDPVFDEILASFQWL